MTNKQVIEFGKYLLSDKRKERIKSVKSGLPLKDRLKEVYHADLCNFKDDRNI